jgi:glycosyltransferase involved in cell wall biosynthesis
VKILLIIPAYNEEKNIGRILDVLCRDYKDVDVLVVNDCSTDKTSEVVQQFPVALVNLPCNLGIGGAVQTGYKYAWEKGYDIAVQVDGDGQHNPAYLKDILQPLIDGEADLVIGSRYIDKTGFQSTRLRRVGIVYFSKLLKMCTGQLITDPTSGFRACNKAVIEMFSKRYPVDYPEPESIMFLKRNQFRISEVAVQMEARLQGKSSITSFKSVYYMAKVSMAILIDSMRKQIV